ncbi:MAG: hypothetical protein H7831_12170 [Magnetococcus sp. WYHC-3]
MKYILGHYESPQKTAPLKQFLVEMTYPLRHRTIPPFAILNQMLETGVAPRTGEWEPFAISQPEYDELVSDLLADPSERFKMLEPGSNVKTPDDWFAYLESVGY